MEKSLPLRILSTRALGNDAVNFIRNQNWLVDIISFIETHGIITVDLLADFIAWCNDPEKNIILLFSSDNSVKWLKWGLDKYGLKLPPGLRAYVVGEKTLHKAKDLLKVEPIYAARNSQALLSTIGEMEPSEFSVLYCCGNNRLNTLPAGLKQAGYTVKEYIVYKTAPTPHITIRDYNAVLFFSPSGVESYFSVNSWNDKMVAVSIGHTTADALKNAGVKIILVADEPNELSMVCKLYDYLKDDVS